MIDWKRVREHIWNMYRISSRDETVNQKYMISWTRLRFAPATKIVEGEAKKKATKYDYIYLGLKLFWVLFFFSGIITSWIGYLENEESIGYWFCYLTNWSLLLIFIYFTLSFCTSLFYSGIFCNRNSLIHGTKKTLPVSIILVWTLRNIVVVACPLVTLLYWILVYDSSVSRDDLGNWVNYFSHILNSIGILTDFFLNDHIVHFKHVWQPMLFAVVYVIWSLIHYVANIGNQGGGRLLYDSLDWSSENWGGSLVLVMCMLFIAIPLLYSAIYGIDKIFRKIWGSTIIYKSVGLERIDDSISTKVMEKGTVSQLDII